MARRKRKKSSFISKKNERKRSVQNLKEEEKDQVKDKKPAEQIYRELPEYEAENLLDKFGDSVVLVWLSPHSG